MATNKYDNTLKRKYSSIAKQISKHEDNLNIIVSEFINNPQRSKIYWNGVINRLNKEYDAIEAIYTEWANKEIPLQYRFVVKEQMAKAKKLKSITNEAKLSVTQLLKSNPSKQIELTLAALAVNDFTIGLTLGKRDMMKLAQKTRQTLLSESIVDKSIADAAREGNVLLSKIISRQDSLANRLFKAADGKKFLTIIDKNGNPRRYKINYYAEMVSRTKWHDAQAQAVIVNNKNWNTDLIRVSDHNTTTAMCQEYEGKIYSLSGKDPMFPVAGNVPPFHPNCLHYITTVFQESLIATGELQSYADFSNGKIDQPPNRTSFVPIKERNAIVDDTVKKVKSSDKYQNATDLQKKILIRDSVSKEIGKAAA